MEKREKRAGRTGKKASPEMEKLIYPGSKRVKVDVVSQVEVLEALSEESWERVLNYYSRSMQGWENFASHMLEDRGSLSFRRDQETFTVLASEKAIDEDSDGVDNHPSLRTEIRFYLKRHG